MTFLAALALGAFLGGAIAVILLAALGAQGRSDDGKRADLLELENAQLRRELSR